MGLHFEEGAGGEIGRFELEEISGLEEENGHHPLGEVDAAFFGNEFENTGVSYGPLFAVVEGEEHGVGYVEAGELFEG